MQQTTTHRHAILERCDRAVLTVCDACRAQPYVLKTREGSGGDLMTKRFYTDRDAAMWAYQQERAKGATNDSHV